MIKLDHEEQALLNSIENGEWQSKPNLEQRKKELQRYARHQLNSKTTLSQENEIKLDEDVLAQFRATGQGWQTRINDALKEWLAEHSNQIKKHEQLAV